MTAKELAAMLNGREREGEIIPSEEREAKVAGLVVVYGYSDDDVEFVGAIDDEVWAYGGATILLTPAGVLQELDCGRDDCPYFAKEQEKAKTIEAVWHDEGSPCWTFETDIPHETFTIMEGGEPWCIGIVFSMKDLELARADWNGRSAGPNDPLTLEELREIEGKPVPVWCDKANGYIFIAVTKTESYNQVWYFNHKGFACTVLYYSTKFYRRKPEEMPSELERPLTFGFAEHIQRRFEQVK